MFVEYRRMRTMERVTIVAQQSIRLMLMVLFFVGLTSAALGLIWLISMLIFVFDPTIEDPGLVAETPHWLMYPSPLSLLGFLPPIQETLKRWTEALD